MTAMHVGNTLSARSLSPMTSLNPSTNAIIFAISRNKPCYEVDDSFLFERNEVARRKSARHQTAVLRTCIHDVERLLTLPDPSSALIERSLVGARDPRFSILDAEYSARRIDFLLLLCAQNILRA